MVPVNCGLFETGVYVVSGAMYWGPWAETTGFVAVGRVVESWYWLCSPPPTAGEEAVMAGDDSKAVVVAFPELRTVVAGEPKEVVVVAPW